MCACESTTASIDGSRERKRAILSVGVFPAALIQPAIQQVSFSAGFHQVHRAGDTAGRTPERELQSTTAMDMMEASAKR